jgi:hypothetical protein
VFGDAEFVEEILLVLARGGGRCRHCVLLVDELLLF